MVESFELGDVIQTRKPHACGNDKWTVIRVGADIKIKCTACGRIVMMERPQFVKAAKKKITEEKK